MCKDDTALSLSPYTMLFTLCTIHSNISLISSQCYRSIVSSWCNLNAITSVYKGLSNCLCLFLNIMLYLRRKRNAAYGFTDHSVYRLASFIARLPIEVSLCFHLNLYLLYLVSLRNLQCKSYGVRSFIISNHCVHDHR